MKILILIDAKNFEQGFFELCKRRKEFRFIDFHKLNNFIMDYLKNNAQYKNCNLKHFRTYYYTGEFTDKLIEKITEQPDSESRELLEKTKKQREAQARFFKKAKNYYFFELKTKPLQFNFMKKIIFQKGVDVQLAVDLVDFSHKNVFDIAVILSGDVDIVESVKTAKSLGKHIIIFGERNAISEEIKKHADLFIDIGRFTKEQLDKFTHIPENKEVKEL